MVEWERAFALLCAASGAAYLFNDARDAERDRANPVKKHRPVASGELSAPLAVVLALLIAIVVAILAFMLDTRFGAVVVAYLVIQLAYSLGMKNLGVLDTFIVALGFVLRVEAGAAGPRRPGLPLAVPVYRTGSDVHSAGETKKRDGQGRGVG